MESLKKDTLAWAGLVFFAVLHALWIREPYVNLEFAFADAAKGIFSPSGINLEQYAQFQANPLGFVYVAALTGKLWGYVPWVMRLPSLIAGLSILAAGFVLFNSIKNVPRFYRPVWVWATALHPYLWIYSSRATPDMLSAAMMVWILILCDQGSRRRWCDGLSCLLLAATVWIKFNSLFVLIAILWVLKRRTDSRLIIWKTMGMYTGAALVSVMAYAAVSFNLMKVPLIPEAYWCFHFGTAKTYFVENGLSYLGYGALFLGAFPFVYWSHKGGYGKWVVTAVVCMVLMGLWAANRGNASAWSGEFSLGPWNHTMGHETLRFIRLSLGCAVLILFIQGLGKRFLSTEIPRGLLFLWLAFLLSFSWIRPVDRYLIFLYPVTLYGLIVSCPLDRQKLLKVLGLWTITGFALVSLLSTGYQVGQGRAAHRMAEWIIEHHLEDQTDPGAIWSHAGNRFGRTLTEPGSLITVAAAQAPENTLHEEPVRIFGFRISSYYLCPNS